MERINRNVTIDILRIIGILLVILAHCPMPTIVLEIRTFDVVLLVFISGMSFSLASSDKSVRYTSYVLKRFKRLVLPIWIFLIVFLLSFGLLGIRYPTKTIITSFLLLSGIGYVWIFRIFLINSIISPIVSKIILPMKFIKIILLLFILLVGNEIMFYLISLLTIHGMIAELIELIFIFTIGYLCPLILGMKWESFTIKEKNKAFLFFLIIFLVSCVIFNPSSIQIFKHPPRILYVSYGMMMSMLLYVVVSAVKFKNAALVSKLEWLSRHSMGVYLWHVVVKTFFSNFSTFYGEIGQIQRYLFLVMSSILMMKCQVFCVKKISEFVEMFIVRKEKK